MSRLDLVIPPVALKADADAVDYIMGQLYEEDCDVEKERIRRDKRIDWNREKFRAKCVDARAKR